MKVELISLKMQNSVFENVEEVIEEYQEEFGELDDLDQNLFYKAYQLILPHVQNECNKLLEKHKDQFSLLKKAYPQIDFPALKTIKIYFVQEKLYKNKIADLYLDGDVNLQDSLGITPISGGDGITKNADSYYHDEFVVLVSVPENNFIQELKNNAINYSSSLFEQIILCLNTLTHELNHVLLFMCNSGGLTPSEVDTLNSGSEFDQSVFDCILGEFFLRDEIMFLHDVYFDEFSNPFEMMEFYVEKKGLDMLDTLTFNESQQLNTLFDV